MTIPKHVAKGEYVIKSFLLELWGADLAPNHMFSADNVTVGDETGGEILYSTDITKTG